MNRFLFCLLFLGNSLLLHAQQHTVDSIAFRGLKRTQPSLLLKVLQNQKGATVDSLQLAEDLSRLKRMQPIAHAEYTLTTLPNGKTVLTYQIEENFTLLPGLNLYTTQGQELAYRLSLFEFNFLGQNHIVGGYYLRDIFDTYFATYQAPFLFSGQWGAGASFQDLNRLEPVFFPEGPINYEYHNQTLEGYAIFQPNYYDRWELGLSYFKERYRFLPSQNETLAPINEVSGSHMGIRLEHANTKIDRYYQYLEGREYRTILQFTTNANENLNSFFLGRFRWRYFQRVGDKGNFAHRSLLFFATNNDTPFAPFVLDNNLNIRGVGNIIDRGVAGMVFNTEYRHTLFEKNWFVLQGNAFVDLGTWQNPGRDLDDLFNSDNFRVSPGLGLRFMHKKIFNAIFRVDYGVGLLNSEERGFVIGIGQYF